MSFIQLQLQNFGLIRYVQKHEHTKKKSFNVKMLKDIHNTLNIMYKMLERQQNLFADNPLFLLIKFFDNLPYIISKQ